MASPVAETDSGSAGTSHMAPRTSSTAGAAARRISKLVKHATAGSTVDGIRPSEAPTFRFMGSEGRSTTLAGDELLAELFDHGIDDVVVSAPPANLEEQFKRVFTADAVEFVADMARVFDGELDQIVLRRNAASLDMRSNRLPGFLPYSRHIRTSQWQIGALPEALKDRRVDVGDVVCNNAMQLVDAINSGANAVQADFDDGHCPTWENTLVGLHNIVKAAEGTLSYRDATTGNMVSVRPLTGSSSGSSSSDDGGDSGTGSGEAPALLMVRPRAWNMRERHMMVGGREVYGAMLDFGLFIFHCGKLLHSQGRGPFLYLSKVENHQEARLWNAIFTWAEQRLGLPDGATKGCVLIENVLAAFEAEEILWELRTHSAGLNCGMWDYAASFVSQFRHRPEFVLPDRSKYVNMDATFMRAYRDLVIATCHKHGAPATGGMTPIAPPGYDSLDHASRKMVRLMRAANHPTMQLPTAHDDARLDFNISGGGAGGGAGAGAGAGADGECDGKADTAVVQAKPKGSTALWNPFGAGPEEWRRYMASVAGMVRAKGKEAAAGADGAMVYDPMLVPVLRSVYEVAFPGKVNQIEFVPKVEVTAIDLLALPKGDITLEGLKKNVVVGVRFIEAWLNGSGNVAVDGVVEDSATAEISRSQVWQWLRHCARLTDGRVITRVLVRACIIDVVQELRQCTRPILDYNRIKLAARLFEVLVNMREMPDFVTSWLYDQDIFWQYSDVRWL